MTETEHDAPAEQPETPETPLEAPESPSPEQPDDDDLTELEDEEALGDEQLRQQTQAEQGMTEREVERGIQKLEAEAARHAKRVGEIMGEDAQILVPCELCAPSIPGFHWPAIPPDEVVQRVRTAIGLADFSDYAKATHTRECDDCRGRGFVLSGSKVTGKEAVQCPRCNGDGFVRVGGTPTPVVVPSDTGNGDVVLASTVEPATDRDPWGRDPLDPDFGVMPNLVAQRHAVQGGV